MIHASTIKQIIEDKVKETGLYVVDIVVRPGNVINVFLDSNDGVSISDCVQISRHVEGQLNRDDEDYALEVSSAGLTAPFKVEQQYLKNTGKNVKVKTKEGQVYKGMLLAYDGEFVTLQISKKNKKETQVETLKLDNNIILEIKLDIQY